MVLLGDFNLHADNGRDRDSKTFLDILYSADLFQHVKGSTHQAGHTLDLLISRKDDENFVLNTDIISGLPSDHLAVFCTLNFDRPAPTKKRIACRKFQSIDMDQFRNDIQSSSLAATNDTNASDMAERYNLMLTDLLDKHAPENLSLTSLRPNATWYNETVREAKRIDGVLSANLAWRLTNRFTTCNVNLTMISCVLRNRNI